VPIGFAGHHFAPSEKVRDRTVERRGVSQRRSALRFGEGRVSVLFGQHDRDHPLGDRWIRWIGGVVGGGVVEVVDLEEHPVAVGIERAKVVLLVRVVGVTEIVKDRDCLDDPGYGFGAKSRNARGHHRGPSGEILAQFIVQRANARSLAVHDGPPDFLVEEGGWVRDRDPRGSGQVGLSRRLGFVGMRAYQRNGAAMPDELGQVRVVPVLQGEAVALPVEDDGLPPAVVE
jgi:hypothetical protein